MTGFGRGEASNGNVTVVVEMKSVNNRYRDVQLRLPRAYSVVESRIQKALKDRFARGRIDVFVNRNVSGTEKTVRVDPVLAEHYLHAATEVSKRLARDEKTIPISWVLEQPGVLTTAEVETDPLAEWDLVSTALDLAVQELTQMRAKEGRALQRDLDRHLLQIQEHTPTSTAHPHRVGGFQKRKTHYYTGLLVLAQQWNRHRPWQL